MYLFKKIKRQNNMYLFKQIKYWVMLILVAGFQLVQAQPFNGEKIFGDQIAPLLEGMGDQRFEIITNNDFAVIYFNQAIALTYGFNHLEAGRSFKQVAQLDEDVALAYWGQALVLGPNINAAMNPGSVKTAYDLIQQAKSKIKYASELEADLIHALAERYSLDETLSDRAELDEAYAEAMRKVAATYPENPHVQTLFAEALMVLHPWDYWNSDGTPKPWTSEILEVLESGLEKYPNHAGLIHYYIHAVEASKQPERALEGADVLGSLIPGAGHIVHMPSHIYIRTGKYQEGVLANERAIEVDDAYITQCRQQDIYPLGYMPHNRHFLWAMATLQGNSSKAIMAAEHLAGHVDKELMKQDGMTFIQHFWLSPVYAYVRFGKWDKIMAIEKPDAKLRYPLAIWHYARGIAFSAQDETEQAAVELQALRKIASDQELKSEYTFGINTVYDVLQIAAYALEGEMEAARGNYGKSIHALEKAVQLEDNLNYNEPSDWHYPVRQSLGAVLMKARQYSKAEKVYREDLEVFPENGWSLFGLYQSLEKQRKAEEAKSVQHRFNEAWRWADVKLNSSRVL